MALAKKHIYLVPQNADFSDSKTFFFFFDKCLILLLYFLCFLVRKNGHTASSSHRHLSSYNLLLFSEFKNTGENIG